MMNKITLLFLLQLFFITGFAQNTFNGSNNGFWNDNGNWSLGRVPNSFDVAVIPNGQTCTLQNGQQAVAYDIEVQNGGELIVNGELTLAESGTVISDVTNPTTNETWMDRNLGASKRATASNDPLAYGDFYQWGRLTDGHEKKNSETTSPPSTTDIPGHSDFIATGGTGYFDWRDPKNDALWQGAGGGINNPCPQGYRIPTEAEWVAEAATWSPQTSAGALASALKLPMAGERGIDGVVSNEGFEGKYWTSTVDGNNSIKLRFAGSIAFQPRSRSHGFSVRCIKD